MKIGGGTLSVEEGWRAGGRVDWEGSCAHQDTTSAAPRGLI